MYKCISCGALGKIEQLCTETHVNIRQVCSSCHNKVRSEWSCPQLGASASREVGKPTVYGHPAVLVGLSLQLLVAVSTVAGLFWRACQSRPLWVTIAGAMTPLPDSVKEGGAPDRQSHFWPGLAPLAVHGRSTCSSLAVAGHLAPKLRAFAVRLAWRHFWPGLAPLPHSWAPS